MLHRAWELWRVRWNIEEFHPCILVLPHGPPERLVDALLVAGGSASPEYALSPAGEWRLDCGVAITREPKGPVA